MICIRTLHLIKPNHMASHNKTNYSEEFNVAPYRLFVLPSISKMKGSMFASIPKPNALNFAAAKKFLLQNLKAKKSRSPLMK